ncbi:hypothetical protein ABVV53_13130 [Novosphingobium sp. RD2P27]|uniref:Uncharacterized protein n=1 Tax=Novosphingobium kalidii TaxID=3230299 RepID=A0ABV2D3V7_9SPHN
MSIRLEKRIPPRAAIMPLLLISCIGCSKSAEETELVRFALNGISFEVPSRMIRSDRYKAPGFVRINDPDGPIEIAAPATLVRRFAANVTCPRGS